MEASVVAIIQARMASSRLPDKVLLDLAAEPMLRRVWSRTRRARRVDDVLVATTQEPSDDRVADYCSEHGMVCTRGSQFDVLDRYYQAARLAGARVVVRITADCPVVDPALIDDAAGLLLGMPDGGEPAYDFVANRLPPPFGRTFPIGLDVEVCTFAALEDAWLHGHEPQHREHVMPYLYEGVQLTAVRSELSAGRSLRGFRIAQRNHVPDLGSLRWTVDTPEDLEFMRQVYSRMGGRDDFSWKEVLELVQREPALAAINAGVRHKALNEVDERASRGDR
jgi:spore coat polysaccharide biosynthesis protein SpsF